MKQVFGPEASCDSRSRGMTMITCCSLHEQWLCLVRHGGVVRWVAVWIIAEHVQHWRYWPHVRSQLVRDMLRPLGQGVHVDWTTNCARWELLPDNNNHNTPVLSAWPGSVQQQQQHRGNQGDRGGINSPPPEDAPKYHFNKKLRQIS